MARLRAHLGVVLLVLPLCAAAAAPQVDTIPELRDEEARRAGLRDAGRQAEQLRQQLETMERDRRAVEYPAAPAATSAPAVPSAEPATEATLPASAKDEPAGRCDGFSRDMEAVIREEMRGGSAAAMEQLTLRRQQIYLARQRAGC